jgi:hypothetical protein
MSMIMGVSRERTQLLYVTVRHVTKRVVAITLLTHAHNSVGHANVVRNSSA